MENSKINLFVSDFKDGNIDRQRELDFCLDYNLKSGFFNKVISVKERPTYNSLFELTKDYPSDINIISNSDIFFTENILQSKYIKDNQCYALSRWDYVSGGSVKFHNRSDSQDVWIFRGECKIKTANFFMGLPGCDNRVAHEFKENGYEVLNPALSIRAIHLHLSNKRNYTSKDTVSKPYLYVNPCKL